MEKRDCKAPYATHIRRTERTEIAGYDTSHDQVLFDSFELAHDYAMGKRVFDHLDYSQKLESYEYPVSITDAKGECIMSFEHEKA